MKEQLSALYQLQDLDVKIARAQAEIASLDGAKVLKQQLGAAKSALDAAAKALGDQEVELKDAELKLKSIDDKRASFEKRLYGRAGGSPKELQAMEKEVNMLKAQQGQLDGRVLDLYDSVEAARQESKKLSEAVGQAEHKVSEVLSSQSGERSRLEAEIAELQKERDKAASGVTDKSLMKRYDAIRKQSNSTGIAKVVGGRCEGCHVSVTPFIMGQLGKDELERCENCGRILLLSKE